MLWNRKRFKELAKKAFKKNYAYAVAVCFLAAFIAGESANSIKLIKKYDSTRQEAQNAMNQFTNYNNSQAIVDWLNDIYFAKQKDKYSGPIEQVYVSVLEDLAASDTIILRQYEATKDFLVNDRLSIVVGIALGSVLILVFDIFIGNPLIVGKRRFFLENRIEKDYRTPIRTILHSYKKGMYIKTVKVMFFKDLFTLLWMFTIIGGIVKYYEYRAIPYILAENIQLSRKEIFDLSKSIMKGYKWKNFVLDISFFPWIILESLTLGIAGIFYVVPYIAATGTEAYVAIRNEAVSIKKPYSHYLKNPLFDENINQYL